MKTTITIILLLLIFFAWADEASEILKKIDDNLYSDSQLIESRMVIHGRRGSREISTRTWSRGIEDSFTEYLSPPREKGNKMLKLQDDLWIYDKNSDRIIQMSGHLLRQSVNGSDLSYEDFMEESNYQKSYNAEISGEEEIDGKICIVLLLKAKEDDVSYQKRKIWVDEEFWLPRREELYGESGTLLKRVSLSDFRKVNDRWYPHKIHYKDVLNKKGKGTDLIIESIEFNAEFPDSQLSKSQLRK